MRIIPVKSLTSAYYSYEKPWKIAVVIFIVGFFLIPANIFLGLLVCIAGVVYYVLNKNLAVAVVEASGWSGAFAFKRSIIEGQNIDEEAGYEVIEVIRQRIEAKLI